MFLARSNVVLAVSLNVVVSRMYGANDAIAQRTACLNILGGMLNTCSHCHTCIKMFLLSQGYVALTCVLVVFVGLLTHCLVAYKSTMHRIYLYKNVQIKKL